MYYTDVKSKIIWICIVGLSFRWHIVYYLVLVNKDK